jgi:hypothetical protein
MINMKLILSLLLCLLLTVSCQESGESGFAGLEDTAEVSDLLVPQDESDVEILSVSPTADPVIIIGSLAQTFALQVNSGAGEVTYTFKLDGSLLQSSNSPFYSLAGGALTTGIHSLVVTATNTVSSSTYTFNLRKNTAPVVALDTNTSQTINCVSDSFQLDVTASDSDGDALTYDFYLNGSSGSSFLTTGSATGTANVVFTPNCSVSGTNNIAIRATDVHGEYSEYSMAVTVSNPNIATIDSYSPSADPVYILSTLPQTFSVSASGKAPLVYEWKLNGTTLVGATSAIYNVGSADVATGAHTLQVIVSDSDSNDNYTFNIVKNAAPTLSSQLPALTDIKINYAVLKSFSVSASDANSDPLTFTWSLNGSSSSAISTSRVGNVASAILTPNEFLIGSHTVVLTVSDGYETASHSWNLVVNRFSSACNELEAGEVCTFAGPVGFGTGGSTQISKSTRGKNNYMTKDSFDNLYVTDTDNHVIWYYNLSIVDRTVHGIDVPAYSAKIILGNGTRGISPDGKFNSDFKLNYPRDLAFDPVTNSLFVVDYSNYRVVQLLSDGSARRGLCYGNGGNTRAYNEAGPALTRGCYAPMGIALDATNRKIYLAVYGHHNIKEFDITDADYTNWTGGVLVGRDNGGNGAVTSGYDSGVLSGYATGRARTYQPWALDLNADGSLLFFTEYTGDRLKVVNLSGTTKTLMNGAISIPAGHVVQVMGNGGGVTEGTYLTAKIDQPKGLSVYEDGSGIKGFFISSYNRNVVNFVNNTGSTITIGDEDVAAGEVRWVFGDRGTQYNGDNNSGKLTSIWYPEGLELVGDTLYAASYQTAMVRSLDVGVADGAVATPINKELIYDFISSNNPNDIKLLTPTYLTSHPTDNEIYWGEEGSGKIRKVNRITGNVTEVLGLGRSHQDQDMQIPADQYNYYIRGLSFHNNQLMYVDRYNSWAINRGCRVRLYNDSGSSSTFFGTTINDGLIGIIAGNWTKGCGNWEDLVGEQATNVKLKGIEAAVSDGTNMYISNTYAHCILKVDASGVISQFSGDCNATGDVPGVIGSPSIRYSYPSSMAMDTEYAGNMFVVDRSTNASSSYIKYINQSASNITVAGTTVGAGEVATIFTTAGYTGAVAVFGNWICYNSTYFLGYTNNSKSNVNCIDRTNTLGVVGFRVGNSNSDSIIGGRQIGEEYEGASSMSMRLANPLGLTFDSDGNLYIAETVGNTIKMVKRWF